MALNRLYSQAVRAGRGRWLLRGLSLLACCLLGTALGGLGFAHASETEGSGVGVSPDGRHVYVNSRYGTYALARDSGSGGVSLIEHYGRGGGRAMEITLDGGFVYVGGLPGPTHSGSAAGSGAVLGYRRDAATGRLSPVSVAVRLRTLLSGDIAVSPDGRQLYLSDTVPDGNQGEVLRTFSRDPSSGALAERSYTNPLGSGGFAGMGLALSADGRWLHAGQQLFERSSDGGLSLSGDQSCNVCWGGTLLLNQAGDRLFSGPPFPVAFIRDPATGHLSSGRALSGCCSGFEWQAPGGAMALEGTSLYVVDTHPGIVVQARVTPEGLEPVRTYRQPADAPGGLQDARSVAISPDGRHAYVAATADTSDAQGALVTTVAAFRRDLTSGDLAFASLWTEPPPFTPPLPPSPKPKVAIEDGAAFTNDPRVAVRASVPAGSVIQLSHDPRFGPGSQGFKRRASGRYPWRLDSRGPGKLPKVVYARRISAAGSGLGPSDAVKDQIVLDQRSPRLLAARLGPGPSGHRLLLRARDNRSGVRRMQVTPRRSRPGPRRRFRRRMTVSRAPASLWVRVFDGAGNRSRWRRARLSG